MKMSMKKNMLSLALLTTILAMSIALSSVEALDWDKVSEFSHIGHGEFYLGDFACEHISWRLRWIVFTDGFGTLNLTIYAHDGVDIWIFDVIIIEGIGVSGSPIKDAKYYDWNEGWFSVWVDADFAILKTTVIIEQDTDSIPEFTSVALIIGLITVSALAVVLSKKKLFVKT